MKKLIGIVTKVIKVFNAQGVSFVSEDACEDQLEYLTVEGNDIVVGDDNNREDWSVYLNDVTVDSSSLRKMLIEALGDMTETHDGGRVGNWISDGVLVVQFSNSVEFHQDYDKV